MSGLSRYPWKKLKRPGASFSWSRVDDEANLRSAASKHAKRKGIVVSVARGAVSLIVTYERNRLT